MDKPIGRDTGRDAAAASGGAGAVHTSAPPMPLTELPRVAMDVLMSHLSAEDLLRLSACHSLLKELARGEHHWRRIANER